MLQELFGYCLVARARLGHGLDPARVGSAALFYQGTGLAFLSENWDWERTLEAVDIHFWDMICTFFVLGYITTYTVAPAPFHTDAGQGPSNAMRELEFGLDA